MVYVLFQEACLKEGATQIKFHNNVVYNIEVYIILHNTQIFSIITTLLQITLFKKLFKINARQIQVSSVDCRTFFFCCCLKLMWPKVNKMNKESQ